MSAGAAAQRRWVERNPARARDVQHRYRSSEKGQVTQRARNQRRRALRKALVDSHRQGPCVDCGGQFAPEMYDFDHVRGEKRFDISRWMWGCAGIGEAELLEEIAKCEVRCANCHRQRHLEERDV